MKSVGKQLQEARLARNWTPELAARETKIKVDRLRDLEADDYSHFSSPTYARGFVRTYARSLGLDEYKILRQLDNKLPDDDTANIVTDTGVAYLPETAMPPRAGHRDYTGLYIVSALGIAVAAFIAFILFQAYRVGELPRYFAETPSTVDTLPKVTTTNAASAEADAPLKAVPVDPNDTSSAPKAEVVALPPMMDTNAPAVAPADLAISTNAPPTNATPTAPKALPVDATVPPPTTVATDTNAAPRAQPVDLNALASTSGTNAPVAPVALPVTPPPPPPPTPSISARQSNERPVAASTPPPLPVPPVALTNAASLAAAAPVPVMNVPTPSAPAPETAHPSSKRLVLTASQDSFIRVTALDSADGDKPLFASVLHSGQSVGFDGHKFSINVGVPSAVDIKLDGVNYGPHSEQDNPETFTVESHQP